MKATIDKAGRVVIPKELRTALGLVPGEVTVTADGSGVRIEPVVGSGMTEVRGRLVITGEIDLDDDAVRALRLADQK